MLKFVAYLFLSLLYFMGPEHSLYAVDYKEYFQNEFPSLDEYSLVGVVEDSNNLPLFRASVEIIELNLKYVTDVNGIFTFYKIPAGKYKIKVSYIGFEEKNVQVIINSNETIKVVLKPTVFQIGGIEVFAPSNLLPRDAVSKSVINSGEIEHLQATNLKDILELVPGVLKTENFGIDKFSQTAIRGFDNDKLSSLGTLILLDGMPLSNNSNMQFERMQNSTTGISNIGGGIDLRTIPADNINSVEIIRGLPSVKYGDLTEGLIIVNTKTSLQPTRMKFKNNPQTYELNLSGSMDLSGNDISFNFNGARSERDIRKTGDEYTRISGQAANEFSLFDKMLNINQKISGQLIFDEEYPKDDVQKIKNYNRGFSISYSSQGKYKMDTDEINYSQFASVRRENSSKSRLVESDLRVLPNGDTISSYIGRVETNGIEWNIGNNINWLRNFSMYRYHNSLLLGFDWRYEANTGKGIQIDSLFNYYGMQSGITSYNFNKIPGSFSASIYAENSITGNLLLDFKFVFGARYEMYNPQKLNPGGVFGKGDLVNSKQGTYFNPRLNLILFLSENNQLRLSAGRQSKSPTFSSIYPPESVFRWRDPESGNILYFRYDKKVPELKAYSETQYEIAFDQTMFNIIGASLSFYYKERINQIEEQTVPVFAATSGQIPKIYYVDSYSLSSNSGYTFSKGAELEVKTIKLPGLNISLNFIASYIFSDQSRNGFDYKSTPEISLGQYHNYNITFNGKDTLIGFSYPPLATWNDRLQFNYQLNYSLPAIGLWVTFRAEQLLFERNKDYSLEPVDINLLNSVEKENYFFQREIKKKNAKWLFSLNITKSLFKGAEFSFYVNNLLDDAAIYLYKDTPITYKEIERNPPIFFGTEFSFIIDEFFK
ncbi:MAG: TonB-dependent receptor [Ignavibacteriales bacterium]|nr:MAG: TonB-dependent receptor [Ignavibacteriales bacterium]